METNRDQRTPPVLTVLERSRELHILLTQATLDENVLPKVFRDTVGRCITNHTEFIYENISVANSLDLYDKDLSEERKRLQVLCRREIVKLLAALRVLYTVTQLDSDKMHVFLMKAIEVERLLKKWMESDAARQGASLHILKKDKVDTSFFKKKITAADILGTAPVRVDFDSLIKDVRTQAPANYHLDPEKPRYIPPADSLPKAPVPETRYVKMTDDERKDSIRNDGFIFHSSLNEGLDIPTPKRPTYSDKVVPARDVRVEIVPAEPIVVPDDRETPPPKVDPEEEMNKPLAPTVEVTSGNTPEELTEIPEEPSKKEKKNGKRKEEKTQQADG